MQILDQLLVAVLLAVNGNRIPPEFISHALYDMAKLELRPERLTAFAYDWCCGIYANRKKYKDWESLLLVCLELGFRHLDPLEPHTPIRLTHTEHHRGLVDIVFKSQRDEVIADFLCAWTMADYLPEQAGETVGICIGHLAGLHNLAPFSPRLRRLAIRFVERAGCRGFEGAGVEKFVELLDHLHLTFKEMDSSRWASLLMDVIRSSEGSRRLSDLYWELLVELTVLGWSPGFGDTDGLKTARSLIDTEEWGKLECWIGIVWMHIESVEIMEEDLEHSTLLLFRQRPGADQRLEQWMERWRKRFPWRRVPESLQRILTQAHEAAQQQVVP